MNFSREQIVKNLGIPGENADEKLKNLQEGYITKCFLEGTKAEFSESEFNRLQRYHELVSNSNSERQKAFFEKVNANNIDDILAEIEQVITQERENEKSKTRDKKGLTKGTTLYNQLKKTYGEVLTFKGFGVALEWSGLADKDSYSAQEVQKLEQTCQMYFSENQSPEEIRAFHGIEGEIEGEAEAAQEAAQKAAQQQVVETLALPTAESLAQMMVKERFKTETSLAKAVQLQAMKYLQEMVSSGQFEKMAQEERNRLLKTEIHPIRVIEATSQKALAPEPEKEVK